MDRMDIYVQLGEDREGYMPKSASFAEGGSKVVVAEQIFSSMFKGIASIKTRELVAANTSVFACTVGQKPSKARYYLDGTNKVINMLGSLADMADPSSPTPEPSSPTFEVEAEVSKSVSFASPS